MLMITLSGLIGVGKSTLCQKFEKQFANVSTYPEIIDKERLAEFYNDLLTNGKSESALTLQFWFMTHRFKIYQEAMRNTWFNGQISILDRSIWEDSVFERTLYQSGNISKLGHEAYLSHLGTISSLVLVPQVCIFLKVDPQKAYANCVNRNRDFEKDIKPEYFEALADSYEHFFASMRNFGSRVIIIDWNNFGEPKDIIGKLPPDYQKMFKEIK